MESGYEKADSNNLPIVSMEMIHEYYLNNMDYLAPEMKSVKVTRSARDNYGDNAVGYVQLKRFDGICHLKCKITPEHRISKQGYVCQITINELENKIDSCRCEDCAAAAGGCKHAIAFLYWLHRRSEEPSPTDIKCYWKKSKLGDSKKEFVKCSDFPGKIEAPEGLSNRFLQNVVDQGPSESNVMLLKYYKKPDIPLSLTESASIYHLLLRFREQQRDTIDGSTAVEAFIQFCSSEMTTDMCKDIFNASKEQTHSNIWHEIWPHYSVKCI